MKLTKTALENGSQYMYTHTKIFSEKASAYLLKDISFLASFF